MDYQPHFADGETKAQGALSLVGTPAPMNFWVPTECPLFTVPLSVSLLTGLFTPPVPIDIDAATLVPPGHWPFSIIRFSRGKAVFTAWHERGTGRSLLPGYK